jgi:hypothetical protein
MSSSVVPEGTPNRIEFVLRFFRYGHLPARLQAVSRPFALLAESVAGGPLNRETLKSLDFLLLAKDAAVRAMLAEETP